MIILESKIIFWDFDGVIKDSVGVKSDAFEKLFLSFGKEISKKVRKHHEANSGMSRFEKLPIYLQWAGQVPSTSLINQFEKKFSLLVKKKVIDSHWVEGVLDYLQNNYQRQNFFLITATPQKEIEEILLKLKIIHYFQQIVGSPTMKDEAIKMLLYKYKIDTEQAVMIGDSGIDYEAALLNQVQFVLRRTKLNRTLQSNLDCHMMHDFS